MKTIEIKLFSFDELSDEAKAQVIQNRRESVINDDDDYPLSEAIDSLKAIVEMLGCNLIDWQIGPYYHNSRARVDCDGCSLDEFIDMLKFKGYPVIDGIPQFPGIGGFTGICYDDDIAETIYEGLATGLGLSGAIQVAAERIQEISENELEWRSSDEGILESLDRSEEIYTETGHES